MNDMTLNISLSKSTCLKVWSYMESQPEVLKFFPFLFVFFPFLYQHVGYSLKVE